MLIDFSVKNFASFKNLTTLSAETGERLRKLKETNTFQNKNPKLLKSLFLFGPNGSGKSQLIKALGTMQNIVIKPTQTITDKLLYNPFIFSKETRNSNTYFDIKIEISKQKYEYSFTYNSEKIVSEELIRMNNTRKKVIFDRKDNSIETKNKLLKSSLPKLRNNSLFLYLGQAENDPDCGAVFKWFVQDLMFVNNNVQTYNSSFTNSLFNLMNDSYLKKEMISFLSCADFNISDIHVREIPIVISPGQEKNLPANLPKSTKMIFTVHKVYENNKVVASGELPLSNESLGTQRLVYIVLVMMLAQTNGNEKTVVIDEFDDSLHEELSNALVRLFNSKENLNQFIITTHDLQLLDSDLRIDQIYLLDKDFHGISELKSIFDFEDARNKGRRDISFAKRYLQGKFGAVPVIDVDGLLKVLQTIHNKYGEKHGKKE